MGHTRFRAAGSVQKNAFVSPLSFSLTLSALNSKHTPNVGPWIAYVVEPTGVAEEKTSGKSDLA